jgi:hypothetical protein
MTRTAANALALARPRAVRRAPVPPGARRAAAAIPAATARPLVQRLFRGVTGTGGIFQFSR